MRQKQQMAPGQHRQCWFCANDVNSIDYKDPTLLKRFTSSYAKIMPRRRSGACAMHQRMLAMAIKRARTMALLPYLTR